jgi:hypothetical protein
MNAPRGVAADRPLALRLGYPVLAGFFHLRGLSTLRRQPAVLVYQMAKVGSTSVVRALRGSRPRPRVFHVHTLTAGGVAAMEHFYRHAGVPALPAAGHLLVSRYLRVQLARGLAPGRWKVVTMVRDPIARNLSLIFQLGRRLIPDFEAHCDAGRLDPVEIVERFARRYPAQVDCLRWFQDELATVFGVNPFAHSFDHAAGFQAYRGPTVDVLLIRTEDLDRCGEVALRGFLGLGGFRRRRANVGLHRSNGRRYAELLARLRLPADYVDRVYDDARVRHFYTADELNRFRTRWCGRARVPA